MECKDFTELIASDVVDNRSGCVAIKTRVGGNCIDSVGAILNFCPYCGAKIISKYDKGHWDWWHE
jgi:hypothetical protein